MRWGLTTRTWGKGEKKRRCDRDKEAKTGRRGGGESISLFASLKLFRPPATHLGRDGARFLLRLRHAFNIGRS